MSLFLLINMASRDIQVNPDSSGAHVQCGVPGERVCPVQVRPRPCHHSAPPRAPRPPPAPDLLQDLASVTAVKLSLSEQGVSLQDAAAALPALRALHAAGSTALGGVALGAGVFLRLQVRGTCRHSSECAARAAAAYAAVPAVRALCGCARALHAGACNDGTVHGCMQQQGRPSHQLPTYPPTHPPTHPLVKHPLPAPTTARSWTYQTAASPPSPASPRCPRCARCARRATRCATSRRCRGEARSRCSTCEATRSRTQTCCTTFRVRCRQVAEACGQHPISFCQLTGAT